MEPDAERRGHPPRRRTEDAAEITAFEIRPGDASAGDEQALLAALEGELSRRYGGPYGVDNRDPTHPEQFTEAERGAFFVVYRDGRAIGCGGLRSREAGTAEIKRMFVRPEWRGRGISRTILKALEDRAVELGYDRVILESGTEQPEACRLYETSDYSRIEPYGVWKDSPDSICYEKSLATGP